MFLIFDTETTGFPKDWNAPHTDYENWPRMVQIAWQSHDEKGNLIEAQNYIVKPEGFTIPYAAEKVHGISTEKAIAEGLDLKFVLEEFAKAMEANQYIIGHNVSFDNNVMGAEYVRAGMETVLFDRQHVCTKEESTDYCAIPGGRGGKFKWPNLSELHAKLFGEGFDEAHNASADVEATARCFLELVRLDVINSNTLQLNPSILDTFREVNPEVMQPAGIEIISNKTLQDTVEEDIPDENFSDEEFPIEVEDEDDDIDDTEITTTEKEDLQANITAKDDFVHLHVHTQYSILDGAAEIPALINKAKEDGMSAVAITDHGNMFGAKLFHKFANKAGIKPILGVEAYVAKRTRHDKEREDTKSHHLVLLAKNETGYKNLIKMVSYAWTEGMYYKPRIDKDLLKEYHEGVIASSACLGGEVAQAIMNEGPEEAEKVILEFKEIFGDDYYLEMQRHRTGDPEMDAKVYDDQVFVNKTILELAKKHNVKVLATNDSHFINAEDAPAHDRLICLSTGKDLDDPNRMKYTAQEWFKTKAEMHKLFADVPEALANTVELAAKVESYSLDKEPIMPDFELPEGFTNEDDYLRHITYEGAKWRWGEELDADTTERIDFELETIKKMGFPGYFLIVWDFLKAARELGVSVGPGRGSAAGSAVAYCLRITEIDPIKYNLLFERFLNPDRISMPDIDIDFDDDGRGKVLEYVVNKYGSKRVAHIITFGTMAAKSSIRDVARVQKLPLDESDKLAKLVPEKPGTTLTKAYKEVHELKDFRDNGSPEVSSVLKFAEILEGSVRNTGTHACGVIIGKDDLENYIPICTAKDSELDLVTQYDGKHVEDVGLLKMDFLGLKTLSIIKAALENIKLSRGIDVDIENVDLEDKETYDLYSRGETTGLFQFESDGMKKHLKDLKPSKFEDLIAMNALYRPGPMDYIPDFINRKHGRKKIEYDFDIMEEVLQETYGITVYQEQVMLLSRTMAGFTRGQADSLRKAMGKKIQAMMDELKPKFIEGCKELHGLEEKGVIKVWEDWEKFASYAFNKSHATCYSFVSYQTGYLKAHYPAEFMAAVLSHNLNDIKKITFFMDECKRMGMSVKGPSVNESYKKFTVNKKGDIRFGMAAIKGVGEAAVENIIKEREENGPYKDIYDFVERINLHAVNKKSIEALAISGAFDDMEGIERHQFFAEENDATFLEKITSYGNKMQTGQASTAPTLFGESADYNDAIEKPKPPNAEPWPTLVKLNKEKELIGIYLSAHPLDSFKFELKSLHTTPLSDMEEMEKLNGRDITVCGLVTDSMERLTKTGKPFGAMTIEDYTGSYRIMMFSKDFMQFKSFFTNGYSLIIKGKVQNRPWGDTSELEFKVTHISMLSDVREDLIKTIQLKIPLENLTEKFIKTLTRKTEENEGKVLLKFMIYDREENLVVDMFSRNRHVNVNDEFVKFLDNCPELEYKVNG